MGNLSMFFFFRRLPRSRKDLVQNRRELLETMKQLVYVRVAEWVKVSSLVKWRTMHQQWNILKRCKHQKCTWRESRESREQFKLHIQARRHFSSEEASGCARLLVQLLCLWWSLFVRPLAPAAWDFLKWIQGRPSWCASRLNRIHHIEAWKVMWRFPCMGGSPSHHLFIDGIFHENHAAIGDPSFMETIHIIIHRY